MEHMQTSRCPTNVQLHQMLNKFRNRDMQADDEGMMELSQQASSDSEPSPAARGAAAAAPRPYSAPAADAAARDASPANGLSRADTPDVTGVHSFYSAAYAVSCYTDCSWLITRRTVCLFLLLLLETEPLATDSFQVVRPCHMLPVPAAAAAQAAEVAEGGGAAALGVLVRVAKLEAALREERAAAAQVRSQAHALTMLSCVSSTSA